jgi:hypothetical protein
MSFMLDNADLLEGDATSASEVDFVISGIANVTRGQLADGQLANSKGTLYTAASSIVVSSVIYTNTGAAHNHVNLYSKSSGGTSRRLIPKDLQLESGYALYFDGVRVTILDTLGGIVSGVNVSDTSYAASWDGVTGVAPSKNAVYDKLQLMTALFPTALGAANLKQFMNAAGTAPEWASGIKIGTLAVRNMETVTGDVAYTNIGFKPSAVIFLANIPGIANGSIGFDDGTLHYALGNEHTSVATTWQHSAIYSIIAYTAAGAYQYASISALGADGFTLSWVRTGGPTGLLNIAYMAFR